MIVANFTPDPINWMHMGITGTIPGYDEGIKPNEDGSLPYIVDMEDGRAKHLLNAYAKIGLVQMRFGDDVKIKMQESQSQNRKFWEHQIEVFNQNNEQQKEAGNRYSKPTAILSEKAELFGLELKKPWMIPKRDDSEIQALREENRALKAQNDAQGKQIAEILEMLKSGNVNVPPSAEEISDPKEPVAEMVATNRKKYASLTEKTMKGWLKNNWDDFQGMPEENKFEIETKYKEFYETPFPAEKPS